MRNILPNTSRMLQYSINNIHTEHKLPTITFISNKESVNMT